MRIFLFSVLLSLWPLPGTADTPRVLTDIPVVHSLVSMVMGDIGVPDLLVAGNADPHHFQMRPSQARNLANTDILFWIGKDLTPWLDRAYASLGDDVQNLALFDVPGTALIESSDPHHAEGGADMHAWLDPMNATLWLQHISDELSTFDPDNALEYERNAEQAIGEVEGLIDEVSNLFAASHPAQIIVGHDAFDYFANRFGITIVGAFQDREASAPSAAHIFELQEIFRTNENICIFRNYQQDPDSLLPLIHNSEVEIGVLDPLGSALEPAKSLYVEVIWNLALAISNCTLTENQ